MVLGGGTFALLGKTGSATNVSVGGLTLSSGSGSGFAVDGGNSISTTLNISGPITATIPGTSLDILTTTSGSTTGIVTTTAANANGILSGRIVLNGTDFAANGATPGTSPIAAPTYSPIASGSNSNNSLANNNASVGSGLNSTNSLKITDSTTGQSLTIGGGLSLISGGLLFTGASNYSITGGTLQSGTANPSDLIVHQYGTGTLTIASTITDGNGPSTLTKTGPGTLLLSGANNYTGTTYVTAGTLALAGTTTSPSFLVNNATLSLQAGGAITSGAVTLTGSGNLIETAANGLSGNASLTLSSGVPTATLSQSNNYTGNTTINAGTLQLANATAAQNSTINLAVANGLTFSAGLGATTVGGLTGAVNLALADIAAGSVTVQLANTTSISYTGVLSGPGGITQIGSGTTTLTAGNTYTGLTTVSAGSLVATNNTSFGPNTSVTDGLVLNPSSGTATVDFTSTAPSITSLASSGAGAASVVLGNASATPNATTLTIGGNNASTTFAGVISDLSATNPTAAAGALTKVGTGALVLTNANTYTGITTGTPPTTTGTTFNGGTLVVGNVQALGLPNVPLVASPSSTGTNTITLDIATDTSVDPYNLMESNSGTLIIEADKATAASPGITQSLGMLSYGAATLTIAAGPNVSGGSPTIAFGNVTLNSVHNNTTILNPTTANLLLQGNGRKQRPDRPGRRHAVGWHIHRQHHHRLNQRRHRRPNRPHQIQHQHMDPRRPQHLHRQHQHQRRDACSNRHRFSAESHHQRRFRRYRQYQRPGHRHTSSGSGHSCDNRRERHAELRRRRSSEQSWRGDSRPHIKLSVDRHRLQPGAGHRRQPRSCHTHAATDQWPNHQWVDQRLDRHTRPDRQRHDDPQRRLRHAVAGDKSTRARFQRHRDCLDRQRRDPQLHRSR